MEIREELRDINQFAKAELTEDQVYAFTVRLCDNEVDRDFERFDTKTLKTWGRCFWARAVFLITSGLQRARRPAFTVPRLCASLLW